VVSGTEQSANSQPAASGSGAVTISGAEQAAQTCPTKRCFTIYDTGTVTLAVGSYPGKSVNYGRYDTPATIAWMLSCAFHNDSSSPADAPCPASAGTSTTVNLTARATGTSTNYSFTITSATSDTTGNNFGGPSFFAAPASGALTGGHNAAITADFGMVTITVNGAQASVTVQ